MKKSSFAVLTLALAAGMAVSAGAQTERKPKSQVNPQYPELARRMNVSGSVRLEVTVGPNGVVRQVKALGGHPLLIESAMEAVRKWRYDAGAESVETVVVNFRPQS